MPSEDKRALNQKNEQEELENKFQDIHKKIMKTVRDRKRSEEDYLEIIKKQKKYWEDRLKNTDPEKDKDRYNELEENIKREIKLIKQINEELSRIEEEYEMEREHKKREEERKERS